MIVLLCLLIGGGILMLPAGYAEKKPAPFQIDGNQDYRIEWKNGTVIPQARIYRLSDDSVHFGILSAAPGNGPEQRLKDAPLGGIARIKGVSDDYRRDTLTFYRAPGRLPRWGEKMASEKQKWPDDGDRERPTVGSLLMIRIFASLGFLH